MSIFISNIFRMESRERWIENELILQLIFGICMDRGRRKAKKKIEEKARELGKTTLELRAEKQGMLVSELREKDKKQKRRGYGGLAVFFAIMILLSIVITLLG